MVRLEARPAVLALVILSSRGNVAGQMVARVALARPRIGSRSFSAVGASSSLSALVLSTSAGNANGGAGGRSYGASVAGRAGGAASRSKLVAADRAVGAGRLTGGRISLSRGALGAGDRPSAARVMASIQSVQAAAPGLFEYVPIGQLAQSYCEGEPVEPRYFPSPQSVQVGAPGTSLYLPVSQLVQDVAVRIC